AISGTGNGLANVITGNGGANILDGGGGKDTLKGFGGADTFVFDTKLGTSNVDHIVDFSAAADTIRLDDAVFTALPKGSLSAAAFKVFGTAPEDANDRILYNRGTGALFYDPDGSGLGSTAQFAVLDNHATITAADFRIA
ncbi:MAG: hypothetical protein ACREET_09795, partial [Stellaceae bacterium]